MKKLFKQDVKSRRKCSVCGKFLKLNLVVLKPKADKCFLCHVWAEGNRGHIMKDLPSVPEGTKPK